MSKRLQFVKLAYGWYVILPEWEGEVGDLQMVCGADLMLESIAKGESIVTLVVANCPFRTIDQYKLVWQEEDDLGATYKIESPNYTGLIWLCNVTKSVFSKFPEYIYFVTE